MDTEVFVGNEALGNGINKYYSRHVCTHAEGHRLGVPLRSLLVATTLFRIIYEITSRWENASLENATCRSVSNLAILRPQSRAHTRLTALDSTCS